jgi:hypothetical protein
LVTQDEVAGRIERDAAELGESDFRGGDAGADLAAGHGIDNHLRVEWYSGEEEKEEDGF